MSAFDRFYYARLRRDITRWQQQGLVDADTAKKLALARPGEASTDFTGTLIRLGVALLLFSALSFVAANWEAMSKLARLGLLISLMWGALGAGWWAGVKEHRIFEEASLLGAAGLFGINIVLIAQMYHIDSHFPDGYWLAAVGALVIAGLMGGELALLLGWVLLAIWSGSEILFFDAAPHWGYLPFGLLAAGITFHLSSAGGAVLGIVSTIFWLVATHFSLLEQVKASHISMISVTVLLALALLAVSVAIIHLHLKGIWANTGRILFVFSLVAFFVILDVMQLAPPSTILGYYTHANYRPATMGVFIYGLMLAVLAAWTSLWSLQRKGRKQMKYMLVPALVGIWALLVLVADLAHSPAMLGWLASVWILRFLFLSLALWAIYLGQNWHHNGLIYLGLLAFALEVIFIYVSLFGSLMDTSLFFLVGGVLLLAGGYGLEKWRKQLLDTQPERKA